MWNQEKADAVLAEYGGSHFIVQRDGTTFVVVGGVNFLLTNDRLVWGASDAEIAADAIGKAKESAA